MYLKEQTKYPLLEKLFQFCQENNLLRNMEEPECYKLVRPFFEQLDSEEKKKQFVEEENSFYHRNEKNAPQMDDKELSLYNESEITEDERFFFFETAHFFDNAVFTCHHLLEGRQYEPFKGSVRQESPPLAAYGIKVKPTPFSESYAYLYE